MKKAIKISAVLVALIVLATMAFVFTSSAGNHDVGTVADLKAALMDGEANTVVKLTADLTLTDADLPLNVEGSVILDLNGHKLTTDFNGNLFEQDGIANPKTFVIKDTAGNGAIIAPAATLTSNFSGTVKLEGGTFVVAKVIDDTADRQATVTISQTKGDSDKGTWININPVDTANKLGLVLGFASTDATAVTGTPASSVDAAAKYYVAPAVYTITYTLPTGAANPNSAIATYTIWESHTFADATKDGMDFDGWFLREYDDKGNIKDTPISGIAEGFVGYNIEVVAKFTPHVYNITYVGAEDGSYENDPANPATFTVTEPNIQLGVAAKKGYTFLGWYTNAAFTGTPVTQIECSTTFNDLTLYPKFEVINYTITYVTYGGTFDSAATVVYTFTVENAVTFLPVAKNGYEFKGWTTTPTYSEDTVITGFEAGRDADITVYAQYDVIEYTITYVEDDKITSDYSEFPSKYTVETKTFALPVPEVAKGYTFLGWKDGLNNIVTHVEVGTTGHLSFTPVFEETTYKIFYDYGNFVNNSDVDNTYNLDNNYEYTINSSVIGLVAPKRAHYDFLGWATHNTTGTEEITYLPYDEANKVWTITPGIGEGKTIGNITVYAVWKPTEYSITYGHDADDAGKDADGYAYKLIVDVNGKPVLDANGDVQYEEDAEGKKTPVFFEDDKAVLPENAATTYNYITAVELPVPTREGYTFKGWYDTYTKKLIEANADGKFVVEAETRSGDMNLEAEWEIRKYKVELKYQFNDDYWTSLSAEKKAELAALGYGDEGRTFKSFDLSTVVYGTRYEHAVDFVKYNGFIPQYWNFVIEEMPAMDLTGDNAVIIYFEPVVLSTTFADGKLVVKYHDGTVKELELGSVSDVKLDGNKIIYVNDAGESTTVAVATAAELATLTETVNNLKTSLESLTTQVNKNKEAIAALEAALANLPSGEDFTKLQSDVAALQALVEELEAKDTTYLILIIIVAVIAVAAAAGVVVLFVKKK